jgi:hypothetical protein
MNSYEKYSEARTLTVSTYPEIRMILSFHINTDVESKEVSGEFIAPKNAEQTIVKPISIMHFYY